MTAPISDRWRNYLIEGLQDRYRLSQRLATKLVDLWVRKVAVRAVSPPAHMNTGEVYANTHPSMQPPANTSGDIATQTAGEA